MIKVQDGTIGSVGGLGLCGKCKHSHVREMRSETMVVCQAVVSYDKRISLVTSPVLRCRDYAEVSQPSRYDLEQIAWVLNTDEKTKKIGFKPPKNDGF